jgi:hypothetical protein
VAYTKIGFLKKLISKIRIFDMRKINITTWFYHLERIEETAFARSIL